MSEASKQRLRSERTQVALSAAMEGEEAQRHARLVNLSATGCLMETDEPLREGEQVRLRFSLPGQTEVEVIGTVARVAKEPSGTQVGIAFAALDEHKTEHLARHVATQRRSRKKG